MFKSVYNVHREWHWLLARKSDVSKTSHLLKPSLWGVKLCKSIAMNISEMQRRQGWDIRHLTTTVASTISRYFDPWPCISRTCLRKIPDMNAMSWTVQELHCRCKTFTAAASGIFRVFWSMSCVCKIQKTEVHKIQTRGIHQMTTATASRTWVFWVPARSSGWRIAVKY